MAPGEKKGWYTGRKNHHAPRDVKKSKQGAKKGEEKWNKGAMCPSINTMLSQNGRFAIILSMFSHARNAYLAPSGWEAVCEHGVVLQSSTNEPLDCRARAELLGLRLPISDVARDMLLFSYFGVSTRPRRGN